MDLESLLDDVCIVDAVKGFILKGAQINSIGLEYIMDDDHVDVVVVVGGGTIVDC